ncbi:MAG: HD domain-containing protein [Candidatus Kaiserbacteria bacterium]|nr:HD domain-containing protein [Candidatus Kaiserbacteria bacterium]MCB9816552.1 HD domain-containing protein [Candidatus Nomurabacteria bacterium]
MITPQNIPIEVRQVAKTLEDKGFEAYVVGGCTRDLLLGKIPKDWDLTTNATPEEIQALFPEHYANNDYGTVGIKTESEHDSLKVIEVTPYRTESGYSDARRPDEVTFGVSLEEDLQRRDFTVNALAYRISTDELVDNYDGLEDLAARRLKAVGDANERFSEDALRMMRAVRLAAELDFMIEAETMAAITRHSQQLSRISIERIASEFLRTVNSPTPMQGIIFMEKLGLLEQFLPELRLGIGIEQGGAHAYDVYEHLLRTMQAAADKDYSLAMRLAALFHDIAKPQTRREGGKNKQYTFFGHEVVGARMTSKIMDRLRLPRELSEEVINLVRWHMFFADPDEITLAAVRRTITRIGEDHIEDLLSLRVCDRIGMGRPKEQPFRFRKYKAMVDEALRDPISVKMLKINGDRIMELSGEKPGRRLGYILHALLEEALDDASKNTEEFMEKRALELLEMPEETLVELAEAGKRRQAEEEEAALKDIAREHHVG